MIWFAHSWYFFPGPRMHELEIGYDLRRWMVGFAFGTRFIWLTLGPIMIAYRTGI